MTYLLRIWEHSALLPEPVTFELASQTARALQATQSSANPKFTTLVLQLLKHHPSQASDPTCLHSAWRGDPLKDAQTGADALFTLGLPPADRVELLRLVVDQAAALGLTVFDDQDGMVFLPSGTILPEERATSWVLLKAQMDSEAD
jgi:hypothetical protein